MVNLLNLIKTLLHYRWKQKLQKLYPKLKIIVISARSTLITAVRAQKKGAYYYLPKPFDLDEIINLVSKILHSKNGYNEKIDNDVSQDLEKNIYESGPIIGKSKVMQETYKTIAHLVSNNLSVLITGESGTGKNLVARAIHDLSTNNHKSFIKVTMSDFSKTIDSPNNFKTEDEHNDRFTSKLLNLNAGTILIDGIDSGTLFEQAQLINLLENENILGGQDANQYSVTYYESYEDAQSGNNAINTDYTNSSNPQQIFARVEHIDAIGSNSGCFSISDFMIEVTGAVPDAISPGEYVICEPIFSSNNQIFDLESQNEIILEGQNVDSYNITYHISEEDALSGLNSLESQYENISNPQTIYVRVEDTNAYECYSTTSFDLVVCLIPEGISPNNDGYNDSFELKGYNVQSLKIYNRYGKLVFSTTNYADNWEGQSNEGNKLPVGTYFYHMIYDENLEKTGWVYINY